MHARKPTPLFLAATLILVAACSTPPKVRMDRPSPGDLVLIDERADSDKAQAAMSNGYVLGDTDFSPAPPEFIRARLAKVARLSQRQPKMVLHRFRVVAVGEATDLNRTASQSVTGPSAAAAASAVGGAVGGLIAALVADSSSGRSEGLRGDSIYVECDLLMSVNGKALRVKTSTAGQRSQGEAVVREAVTKALDQLADQAESTL